MESKYMEELRAIVADLESRIGLPNGDGDRFAGYAVIGLPFRSGHVLALRRFYASSVGPAYTSVWHRTPSGSWTFYQDVPPNQSCPRYFGADIQQNIVCPIQVDWTGPCALRVSANGTLRWEVQIESTLATRSINFAAALLPDSSWRNEHMLRAMARLAQPLLRTGNIRFSGRTPNGQTFIANPRRIWSVRSSHAVVDGTDLGPAGPLAVQARLADFVIPQRGMFAITHAFISG
jgi:hypothetical protein